MEKESFKKDISKRENMFYDALKDESICQNVRKLKVSGIIHRKSKKQLHIRGNSIQK